MLSRSFIGIAGEGAMPLVQRTIVDLREEMALQALDEKNYSVTEVAETFGVSRPTVRLWRDRYRKLGRGGLLDRSHAPRSCPHRTLPQIEEWIVAERRKFGWGSKKILQRLREEHPGAALPKRATIDAILVRRGLIDRRPRRRRYGASPFLQRYPATDPGDLMTIDFKGQFRLGNGRYCYPLTIVDSASRYLLACKALQRPTFDLTWPVVMRIFREHGLPHAMQSDNGPPFGSTYGRFSTMSVRLMMLGVRPVFNRPGRPSDNGRHERMHRELKAATRPPCQNFAHQQQAFDDFQNLYNCERPHEGIGMQRPARVYRRSVRSLPSKRSTPNYPMHAEKRAVTSAGCISWHGHLVFISETLRNQIIALEPTDDAVWTVYFHQFVIGKFDEKKKHFL
jgi:transposase InsO family protein